MSDDRAKPHGWLILDKPPGLGSTQAVGAVKRNLREGGYPKVKVGHGGTLDPLAEGVLPIALGEATKLSGRMLDSDKTYEFSVQFGEETDTLDAEGEVVARSDNRPPRAAIAAVCEHFTGKIEQVPPRYSALKVDGRRAYDLARSGEEVDLEKRAITVHSLDLLGGGADERVSSTFATTLGRPDPYDPQAPLELAETATFVARVSKGTYIRSLARDIAHALGTVGHVTYLRRTKAGPFDEQRAISLDLLNEIGKGAPLRDIILPLEAGLDGIPALTLDPESEQAVRQGRVVSGLPHADGLWFATSERDVPVALIQLTGGATKIVRGFNV
ncbi:tRNA pseudouridine(55) synthase TruB [Aurantiacibacter spongiae]|uniref:tRNA pseudouridine synthase B n=1 Tax=Aurantiacibacter spongiae TaxID=2488860 RepID=A0A3N5DK98_9SPHN|nr:tRNA pseudouridine(55) synthase TruB [Aurantiacibacter spongiae]RPF72132.1 tRNA pseudouridine(55) synthase TruB [Aurantiacibacter spongiae]